MVRLLLSVLAAPTLAFRTFASRVEVHSVSQSFEHLSEADSLEANNALDILAQLKINSDDVALQEQYRAVIGEIEWEEDRAFLLGGMNHDEPPPMLGAASQPDGRLKLAELLTGRLGEMSWFTTRVGRFFTGRRDFAIEEAGGETKYTIDGITRSLHSRMQVSFPNEPNPRYVVRRAFNYLNPVAGTIGQYVYRVLRCTEEQGGWAGGCREGEMLYTITKDRLGRGAMWGQDEYRVYTGTGGCNRHGYGVLSCRKENQIMYSISAGLRSGTFDTTFYNGHINAIDGDHASGRLYDGTELNSADLMGMQVATVSKVTGSPRPLNWPNEAAGVATGVSLGVTVRESARLGQQLHDIASQLEAQIDHRSADIVIRYVPNVGGQMPFTIHGFAPGDDTQELLRLLHATPAWNAAGNQARLVEDLSGFTGHLASAATVLAWTIHLAKSLIWADSYDVTFNGGGGSSDELLVSIVAAVQDLTREIRAVSPR